LAEGVPVEKIDQVLARQPLRRLGTLDEVSHVGDFFLDSASGGMTGQILYLGGESS